MDNLSVAILKELECPVCIDYMHPPIRQCILGHTFCDKCYERVNKCPTCRNPKGTARSYALENLHQKLSFPCRNQVVGCNVTTNGKLIKKHEEICPYAPLDCPLKVIDNCEWRGHLTDVIRHCKDKHPSNVYITSMQKLTCTDFLKRDVQIRCYYILFKAYEEIFKVALQINYQTNIMKWCVYHLASYTDESATNYSYEIEIDDRNSLIERKISFKSPCQPIKPIEDTFSNQHCLITHYDMIKNFCVDDDLIYTVKIYDRSNGE